MRKQGQPRTDYGMRADGRFRAVVRQDEIRSWPEEDIVSYIAGVACDLKRRSLDFLRADQPRAGLGLTGG
jgi:hypothetical protein